MQTDKNRRQPKDSAPRHVWRKKPSAPPTPAKECIILKGNKALMYDEEEKLLFHSGSGFTVFPSKKEALTARWHAVQNDVLRGQFGTVSDYIIEET